MSLIRFAHISTVVTRSDAFNETVNLLTHHGWHNADDAEILVMGERKTSRVSVVVLAATERPRLDLTDALEAVAPTLNAAASSPVLAHQRFNVPFADLAEREPATTVRLTRLGFLPSGVDVLEAIGREAVVRLRSTTTGFCGAIGLTSPALGKAIFIELFTSRTALRDSEVTAYFDARNAREAGVLTEPPEHEVYQLYPRGK